MAITKQVVVSRQLIYMVDKLKDERKRRLLLLVYSHHLWPSGAIATAKRNLNKMNVNNAERALKSYCHAKGYEKPIYVIVSKNSRRVDGNVYRCKFYVCSVTVSSVLLAFADGYSKRIARKKAAMFGLQKIRLMELHQLFTSYAKFKPTQQMITSNEQQQLRIEELIATDCTMTPIDRARRTQDPSEELIFQAIEKLRSFKDSDSEDDRTTVQSVHSDQSSINGQLEDLCENLEDLELDKP